MNDPKKVYQQVAITLAHRLMITDLLAMQFANLPDAKKRLAEYRESVLVSVDAPILKALDPALADAMKQEIADVVRDLCSRAERAMDEERCQKKRP